MASSSVGALDCGSLWHRWDPHIHAPNTILNNGYAQNTGWEDFLTRVERSDPPIRALGITDYYSTDCYREILEYKQKGRLANVELIFPNVELRLNVGTDRGSPVNIHLLVSPYVRDHVSRLHAFLSGLEFQALKERYRCTREDLVRLGYAHDQEIKDDRRALEVGTNQFKVSLDQLRDLWNASDWAQSNILIAVPASKNDGTAGLQKDASLARMRREIEAFAHIIFSSNPRDRAFWLGRGAVSKQVLEDEYQGCKPCIHGSDAHRGEDVGQPDQNRYCWLKGALIFETLSHACLEPEGRAIVSETAPEGPLPSKIITSITLENAPFLKNPVVPLNPGLIGIIGARGSGKTALADFIATGAYAFSGQSNTQSFINRAQEYLAASSVILQWKDGAEVANSFSENIYEAPDDEAQIRYLSQQFVDRLCSAEGLTDELLREIQRVIFQAHEPTERLGATDFEELLSLRADRFRSVQQWHREQLDILSDEYILEREKAANEPKLKAQRDVQKAQIQKDIADRLKLVAPGGEERAIQFGHISAAAQFRSSQVDQLKRRYNALTVLRDDVADMRTRRFPEEVRQMQHRHRDAQLSNIAWAEFSLGFVGDVEEILEKEIQSVSAQIKTITGPAAGEILFDKTKPPPETLIPAGADLKTLTFSLLSKEMQRLEVLIGVDREKSRRITALTQRISLAEAQVAKVEADILSAAQAPARIAEIVKERKTSYQAVFKALTDEQDELTKLYQPLRARLDQAAGTVNKLSFSVRRRADVRQWADRGERLLDARRGTILRGRGALLEAAKRTLGPVWETGTAAEVSDAMLRFREQYDKALVECCPVDKTHPSFAKQYREWAGQISAWLYSTDHISITYGVQYDGVEIERLSPGTRGIVLLLLYLVVDVDDDRPLIIDQPEENLDPKSIFDELVERFKVAKQRRQIIIVTHNANLIVNTDADQVIVAKCSAREPGQLPEIRYISGGLENAMIRAEVCDILEGGEAAFRERARRLRVRM